MHRKRCISKSRYSFIRRTDAFRFSNGLTFQDLPQPKFRIGQYVFTEYLCDDELDLQRFGKLIRSYGWIVGLSYDDQETETPGWIYNVHHISWDGVPMSSFGVQKVEIAEENEMHLAKLSGIAVISGAVI